MTISLMPATVRGTRRCVIGRSVEIALHPWVEIRLNPAGDDGKGEHTYASHMTLVDRAPGRQQRVLDAMLPLGWAVLALVEITATQAHPRPGMTGEHLGILLALIGFASGVAAVMLTPRRSPAAQVPSFVLLIVSSAARSSRCSRNGPGFLGAFIAVAAAALRVRGFGGRALVALALVTLEAAEIVGKNGSATRALLQGLGVVAFGDRSRGSPASARRGCSGAGRAAAA